MASRAIPFDKTPSESWTIRQFGTLRGLVRLGLSYVELASGFAPTRAPAKGSVRRLVFVCHGNICRSAFAQAVARREGFRTAGFGLSTTSGMPAHPPVAAEAAQRGLPLDDHLTTALGNFAFEPGDLLLVMEVRQLKRLRANPSLTRLPRNLLGRFARPPVPHLHDPYMIDPAYLPTCLDRIESAVVNLCRAYPEAKAS
ncbi:phosphotyrosine protein phosphatase [Novosphingobium sp.]|uniref:arsenate reductase/protein-tyrosine-phosphatase family protein n=1 Tax=Novosphingobium sp. TaxID=1874826 RepID=UPI0025DE3E9F|nr:phosphotyrosine protein phosphatase [Novosphingobium sp.]